MIKTYTCSLYIAARYPADVVIPDGYTKIEDGAFMDWGRKSLKNVILPNSIKVIGENAFNGCKSLKSVTISNSIDTISNSIDTISNSIETIPNSKNVIGAQAFMECKSLKNVTIPDGVTKICRYAFSGCSSLKTITIPKSVAEIDCWAFLDCTSLQSVTILNPMIKIDRYAFDRCSALTEVNLPEGLTWSRIKDKFSETPWGKNNPVSEEKQKEEALIAASKSEIVKQALDEVAPEAATTVVNSDSMFISLSMNIMEGIKLNLSFILPDAPEAVKQFASALASKVKEVIDSFSNYFVGKPNEFGVVSISSKESGLTMSVKLTSAYTKGGNFFYMDIKDAEVTKFVDSVPAIIEKIEKWDGVKGSFHISLENRKKPRYSVQLNKVAKALPDLVIIDCIDSLGPACFRNCDNVVAVTMPRKLLIDAISFDDCKSLKEIHIV